MPARKRVIEEVDASESPASGPGVDPLLLKIRNMWEFASLMQYIYLFGEVVKITKDVDVDTLEMECCKPTPSELLPQIGLALLKFVSSHRGLTPELFNEYTRRQYDSKAPNKPNPFGYDEEPRKFADFDISLKLRILHQLSVWTLNNPDRIRQALADEDMTNWRIEPFGWDRDDRIYYILDDNRLYRRTEPALEPPKKIPPKPKPQPKKKPPPPPPPPKPKGSRSSKRQRLANGLSADSDNDQLPVDESSPPPPVPDSPLTPIENDSEPDQDNGLGGAKWECIAITFQEYKDFTESIKKSKDPNEKVLHQRLIEDIFPVLEKLAAEHERKAAQRRREWENLQRLATAKRSSRIADKHEKQKEQREVEETQRKRQEELAMARKEQERQRKIEEARESRMITREQRLRDREMRRILSEQQLAELESQSQDGSENAHSRASERHRQNEIERKRREVEEMKTNDDEWYFDCSICGVHGKNLDDGTHIIACEKCDVWQHSACHGIKQEDADSEDFHFLCSSCQKPRPLKISFGNNEPAQSQPSQPPKKKRGRKPKAATDQADEPKKKRKQDPDAPPSERKKRPKKQHDGPVPQANGIAPETSVSPSNGNLYHPAQGHFFPPSAGQVPRPSGHVFYNYNPSNYSTYHAPNGQPLYTEPTAPPLPPPLYPQTLANGHHETNQSGPNNPPSHGPRSPTSSMLHNPYLNDFSRQRTSSQTNENNAMQTPIPRPETSKSPPMGNFATSRPANTQEQRSRPSPSSMPSIAASPTPSFSATQGNTSIRFSPSGVPNNGSATTYSPTDNGSNPYMPTSNTPTVSASAMSPTKQSSSPPPPLPQLPRTQTQVADGKLHIPKFHSPPQSSTAGISPIKQDMPPSSSRPPHGSPGLGITTSPSLAPSRSHDAQHSGGLIGNTPHAPPSKAPSSMQHILNHSDTAPAPKPMTLPPAPALSPSFGTSKAIDPVPKKIDASPPLPPINASASNHHHHSHLLSDPPVSTNPTVDNVTLPPIASNQKPSPEPTKSSPNPISPSAPSDTPNHPPLPTTLPSAPAETNRSTNEETR